METTIQTENIDKKIGQEQEDFMTMKVLLI
jgi:hypothetical protein